MLRVTKNAGFFTMFGPILKWPCSMYVTACFMFHKISFARQQQKTSSTQHRCGFSQWTNFFVVIRPMKYSLFSKSSVIFIRNGSALSSFFSLDANLLSYHILYYTKVFLTIINMIPPHHVSLISPRAAKSQLLQQLFQMFQFCIDISSKI